jgi:glucosamine-6-phosphate deaminase
MAWRMLVSNSMDIHFFDNVTEAIPAAADWFSAQLVRADTQNVMVAGGNTPLALYAEITRRNLPLSRLTIFALDEYVGVPAENPRTCANLIRRTVVEAWRIPERQFHHLSSLSAEATAGVAAYEERIRAMGGLDVVVLGLGRNGHVGFNEPGSARDSVGRVVMLDRPSVEANRNWFAGAYAPAQGVTVGISTILSARQILLLAFGREKAEAVTAMVEGPPGEKCPASWLQGHTQAQVFLDAAAAAQLSTLTRRRTQTPNSTPAS